MDSCINNYGYEEELFISPPADYLRCGICNLVLRSPVQILDCGHKYCNLCFLRLKTSAEENNEPLRCPIDRKAVDVIRVFEDIALKRIVGTLRVRCVNASQGCEWNGELSELQLHTEKCRYRCRCNQQRPVHSDEVISAIRLISERVEECENSLAEKEKEISHLKFTVAEMRAKYDRKLREVNELKQIVDVWKKESTSSVNQRPGNEGNHEQRLLDIEQKLTDISKIVGGIVRKQITLEIGIDERKEREESFKQKVDSKFPVNDVSTVDFPEDELEHPTTRHKEPEMVKLSEGQDVPDATSVFAKTNTPVGSKATATVTANVTQKQKELKISMQPRGKEDQRCVVISTVNCIEFKDRFRTVILPSAVVRKGMKVFYEVTVVRKGKYLLNAGWATKRFISSKIKSSVGGDGYSYSFNVGSSTSRKCHSGLEEAWGKHLVEGKMNVIGVGLDMVCGQMLFSVNGQWGFPMGAAHEIVNKDLEFFPALTFGDGLLHVNFGELGFKYGPPDESYVKMADMA